MHKIYYTGIDVGSTTVKIAMISPDNLSHLLHFRYIRHNANQAQTVKILLEEAHSLFPEAELRLSICGSGGMEIAKFLQSFYIQEVVANSLVIKRYFPDTKTAIELGGQDAKLIFFYKDEATGETLVNDMRMNGSCAGGTGAFIDQMADLLKVSIEEFGPLAAKGTRVYDISGRCGVFAKTDVQPLINQGVAREDIALSVFHAIAKQTIGGLAQGMKISGPVLFEGGPLTFNPALIRVFQERLGLQDSEVFLPKHPEVIIAHGAAISVIDLYGDRKNEYQKEKLSILTDKNIAGTRGKLEASPVFFENKEEFEKFRQMYEIPKFESYQLRKHDDEFEVLEAFLGIDAGSTTSKFVLINKDGKLLDKFYSHNEGEPLRVIQRGLLSLYNSYREKNIQLKILGAGSTGYGELLFAKAFNCDYHIVETVAHTKAAVADSSNVSFILDIGGQDMKAIFVHKGIPTNFLLNEACSAGCGSFLENYSKTLNIPVEKIAEQAFSSDDPSKLGSRCTVFMNSSIITEQRNGKSVSDIMAGLCRSIIENALTKVLRISNLSLLGDKIVVQGGTFKNDAVLRAFQQLTGKDVIRPKHPGEMGAIGVAILTKEKVESEIRHHGHYESSFLTWDEIEELTYETLPSSTCSFCSNQCSRSIISFSGDKFFVTGNRCEKGEILDNPKSEETKKKVALVNKKLNSVPDMMSFREKLLVKDFPFTLVDTKKNQTIGIPRVLEFWYSLPFWKTFYQSLGYDVTISTSSSYKLFENGLGSVSSDTICLPAKVVHGHILDLIDKKVNRIFNPLMLKILKSNKYAQNSWMCPVIQGYSEIVRINDDPYGNYGIHYDNPPFQWEDVKSRNNQILKYAKERLGLHRKPVLKAIENADRSMDEFKAILNAESEEILESLKGTEDFAVLIVGRPYHNDHFINHDLSKHFTRLGIPVLELNGMPGVDDADLTGIRIETNNEFHTKLFAAALLACRNPNIELVQIVSFGCGHDAIISDEFERVLKFYGGKMPLVLKLDEGENRGPVGIRVKSFIETIKNDRAKRAREREAVPV